jgi:hypothetical protein
MLILALTGQRQCADGHDQVDQAIVNGPLVVRLLDQGRAIVLHSRDPALANPARQYLPGIARIIEASRLSLWTWQLQPERLLRERAP